MEANSFGCNPAAGSLEQGPMLTGVRQQLFHVPRDCLGQHLPECLMVAAVVDRDPGAGAVQGMIDQATPAARGGRLLTPGCDLQSYLAHGMQPHNCIRDSLTRTRRVGTIRLQGRWTTVR
jgi:hypothetical protein